jgi:predicted nucleic acid-binding protein
MENSEQTPKIILLDCDVMSHFIASNALEDLPLILEPHQCVVLDYVYTEMAARPMRLAFLEAVINSGKIKKIDFPDDVEINKEFARIKSKKPLIGEGERACMAVARFSKNVIASSNFRDVAPYCNDHNIHYLGTLDILAVAASKGLYDEAKCDQFIAAALKYNKANFPKGVTAMRFYTPKDLSFLY